MSKFATKNASSARKMLKTQELSACVNKIGSQKWPKVVLKIHFLFGFFDHRGRKERSYRICPIANPEVSDYFHSDSWNHALSRSAVQSVNRPHSVDCSAREFRGQHEPLPAGTSVRAHVVQHAHRLITHGRSMGLPGRITAVVKGTFRHRFLIF